MLLWIEQIAATIQIRRVNCAHLLPQREQERTPMYALRAMSQIYWWK